MAAQDPRTLDRRRRRAQGLCAESGCKAESKNYRCKEHALAYARRLKRFRVRREQMGNLARR